MHEIKWSIFKCVNIEMYEYQTFPQSVIKWSGSHKSQNREFKIPSQNHFRRKVSKNKQRKILSEISWTEWKINYSFSLFSLFRLSACPGDTFFHLYMSEHHYIKILKRLHYSLVKNALLCITRSLFFHRENRKIIIKGL